MKGTSLGLWYVQIPSKLVIDPLGKLIEPKIHNGSKFILKDRKRIAVSKLPHLNYQETMDFKKVFFY